MPETHWTLTLDDAKRMLDAAEAAAVQTGLPYNIAVVDRGAHLVAFARQDEALIGSIELAIDKAKTACFFAQPTANLATLAAPGGPLFGIQESNAGQVVIFGGGVPVWINGHIAGAVGASAGTIEQDLQVAEAAVAAVSTPQPEERKPS
ncbi:GlcG/HbpS family heme-binding protein [Sphingomonas azotifigens]|uniref:GlcG/HbpS family heme-binding protein n=1 Tax=Sphingomonas azotifigens TaxID=330920 RepID=UPI0009FE374C|nr:heme-binding protein [Sphingomonas azotifigens]